MKICFIIDARSPIVKPWVNYFINSGHEVHIISTYPCNQYKGVASFHTIPIAFSWLTRNIAPLTNKERTHVKNNTYLDNLRASLLSKFINKIRHILAPVELLVHVKKGKKLINKINPDIVHAMRIPYEGIFALHAIKKNKNIKYIVSVWGNDFTLFANNYPVIAWYTRKVLKRINYLHADCMRDINLAEKYGFIKCNNYIVSPGAGGVKIHNDDIIIDKNKLFEQLSINKNSIIVLNPRGMRHYVRNDVFFKSIPLILKKNPDTIFIALAMKGNNEAEKWVNKLNISDNVRLLPKLDEQYLREIYRLSDIMISPSLHDGTPNTLLESMAYELFPVVGDIESIREWVNNDINGYLFDPNSKNELAECVNKAIENSALRLSALEYNRKIIKERADYFKIMPEIEALYTNIVGID